jgi:hypothetical protein
MTEMIISRPKKITVGKRMAFRSYMKLEDGSIDGIISNVQTMLVRIIIMRIELYHRDFSSNSNFYCSF